MREISLYPVGYKKLKKLLKRRGFIHRQGSGYISKDKLDSDLINELVYSVLAEQPWLAECVKKIDVTDIGQQHDLTDIVREFATEQAEPARQVGQAEKKNTKEKLSAADEELVARIRKTPKVAEFERLFSGEEKGERADAHMLHMLAFFTDMNTERMAHIYKASALYDPSKSEGYLNGAIAKALEPYSAANRGGVNSRTNSRGNGGYKDK